MSLTANVFTGIIMLNPKIFARILNIGISNVRIRLLQISFGPLSTIHLFSACGIASQSVSQSVSHEPVYALVEIIQQRSL